MIINGRSCSAFGWWTQHLQNSEQNEKVTLSEVVGLDATTIPELFREMHLLARNSSGKTTNFFYQANVNPRDYERLTPAQRHEAKEVLLKNLGLAGQPHFVVEHEKEGRWHFHVIAFRIDLERGTAISDSLTARIHERTSRELEIKFDLERGRSILVPDREFERPERGAKKYEVFRGAQGGIDPERVKADARQAWERADSGVAFKAALEASGNYVLARGDRRDFVIVDAAGHEHSLARRVGGTARQVRERMANLDAASLPSVDQARATQRERHREAEPANFDRDAANRAWESQIIDAAVAKEAASGIAKEARAGATEKDVRPAAKRRYASLEPEAKAPRLFGQAVIHEAWSLPRDADPIRDAAQLRAALKERGIALARVSAADADASRRAAALGREAGRFVPKLREGEIVAVERRYVHQLNERSTGESRRAIADRLASLTELSSVTDAQTAMRTEARTKRIEAWQQEQENVRAPNRLEQRIAKCAEEARLNGAIIRRDSEGHRVSAVEALVDRFRADGERQTQMAAVRGREAFEARVEQNGLALARVTAADVEALNALRQDEAMARLGAETHREAYRVKHFAALEAGDLAAVTRFGDVHRVNPEKVGEAAAMIDANLPGVIVCRTRFASEHEQTNALWDQRREAAATLREDRALDHEFHAGAAENARDVRQFNHELDEMADASFHAGSRLLGALAKGFELAVEALANAIAPPPPLTRAQAERAALVREERGQQRADEAAQQEQETLLDLALAAQAAGNRQLDEAKRSSEEAAAAKKWIPREREEQERERG